MNVPGSFLVALLVAINLYTLYVRWFSETSTVESYMVDCINIDETTDYSLLSEWIHSEDLNTP